MNSSVADIDDFIRAQKQKLSRDRNVTPSSQASNQNRYNENNNNNNNNNQFMVREDFVKEKESFLIRFPT